MAAITISSLVTFFSDEPKSIKRGENHFKSDHVLSFSYCPGMINGKIQASMKDKAYKATVYMSKDEISSSECECPRGNYKCSHAAALVIHAIHNLSRTDIECTWKRQQAAKVVKSVKEMYPLAGDEYRPLQRPIAQEDRKWFQDELKRYGKFTAMAWIMSPEPPRVSLPAPTIENLILSKEFMEWEGNQADYLLERLKVTQQQIIAINDATIGQRDNPVWLMLRKGRLTSSNFGCVLQAKRVTPSLLKRVLGDYNLSGVHAINWGINNESVAVKAFEQATGFAVKESGLWLDPSGTLGASPDGLIGSNALLEVKCPFTQRQNTINEAVMSKDFCLEKSGDDKFTLKKSHIYYHQIQGQLYLTERQLCFFVIWTLKQTFILEIQKDTEWSHNLEKLKAFYKENMLKSILDA